jgi:hypothetical protein
MSRMFRIVARWKDALFQDLRYSVRGLRLRPGFTAMVALTLALGIGANATMFGIVDRLFMQAPTAVVDPDHVVIFHSARLGRTSQQTAQPYSMYSALAAQVPAFANVAVVTRGGSFDAYPLGRGADARGVRGPRYRRASSRCWACGRIAAGFSQNANPVSRARLRSP